MTLHFFIIFFIIFIFYFFAHKCWLFKRWSKRTKKLKEVFKWGSLILIAFIVFIKFTIYKSNGYLIYFSIFSWISAVGVIIWALWPEKFIPDKPQNRNHKKPKKQKIKFEKNKSLLNFRNIKSKNKKGNSRE